MNRDLKEGIAPRYRLNRGWIVGTALVLLLGVPAVWLWHQRSKSRVADELLQSANSLLSQSQVILTRLDTGIAYDDQDIDQDQLKSEFENLSKASRVLWHYVRLKPDEAEGRIRLAEAYGHSLEGLRNSQRSAELYRDAIAVATADQAQSLRYQLADILIGSGEFLEAANLAAQWPRAIDATASDIRTWRVLGLSVLGLWQLDQLTPERFAEWKLETAGQVLENAWTTNPQIPELAVGLASMYRDDNWQRLLSKKQQSNLQQQQLDRNAYADQIVQQMVEASEGAEHALISSFEYKQRFELADAESDLMRVLAKKPNSASANYYLGLLHLQKATRLIVDHPNDEVAKTDANHWYQQARIALSASAEARPTAATWLRLGESHFFLREFPQAIDAWEKGLALDEYLSLEFYPRMIEAHIENDNLADAAALLQEFDGQLSAVARQMSVAPRRIAEAKQAKSRLACVLLVRQEDYFGAVQNLGHFLMRESPDDNGKLFAYRLLAQVYTRLFNFHRAAYYLDLAAALNPGDPEVHRTAATAFAAVGLTDQAASHFESLTSLSSNVNDLIAFAEFLYSSQIRRPVSQRNWLRFDQIVQRLEAEIANDFQNQNRLNYLKLAASIAKSQQPLASQSVINSDPQFRQSLIDQIARVGEASDDNGPMLRNCVELCLQLNAQELADRFAQRFAALIAPKPEAYVVLAAVAFHFGDSAKATAILHEGITQQTSTEDVILLELVLANLTVNQLRFDESISQIALLSEKYPDDFGLLYILFDWTVQLDRVPLEPAPWEARLIKMDGTTGPLSSYLESRRLLMRARNANDRKTRVFLYEKAADHQQSVVRQMPNWAMAYSLAGRIADARLNDELNRPSRATRNQLLRIAKDSYLRAVQLGDRRPEIIFRLSYLMDNPQEAAAILEYLDQRTLIGNSRLAQRQSELLLQTNDLDYAQQLAEAAIREKNSDSSAWLMLANVYLRKQELELAQEAFDQARLMVANSDDRLKGLTELFRYCLIAAETYPDDNFRKQQTQLAHEVAGEILQLHTGDDRKFVEAGLLAAMNDHHAGELYLELEAEAANRPEWLEQLAAYFTRQPNSRVNSLDVVIRSLERLVVLQPENVAYRLQLIDAYSRRGQTLDWQKVAGLLADKSHLPLTGDDQRAQVLLLLRRQAVPTDDRIEILRTAIEQLNGLAASPQATAADQVLLGQVYDEWRELLSEEQQNEQRTLLLDSAREHFNRAAQAANAGPEELFATAEFFIKHRDVDRANFCIDRLTQVSPASQLPSAGPAALRIRLLKATESSSSAPMMDAVIHAYVEQTSSLIPGLPESARANLFVRIAALYELADRPADAAAWYRKAIEFDHTIVLQLAQSLGAQGQKKEAIQLCSQSFAQNPSIQLLHAVSEFMTVGTIDVETATVANEFYQQTIAAFPNDPNVAISVGNAQILHPDGHRAAIASYERGLGIDPTNVLLLNNLATLLAEEPDRRDEALRHINKAIEMYGEVPGLLNTKATILVFQNQYTAALQILQRIANPKADPRIWWLLAETHWRLFEQDRDEAHQTQAIHALDRALEMGLEDTVLTPAEWRRLEGLKNQLATIR